MVNMPPEQQTIDFSYNSVVNLFPEPVLGNKFTIHVFGIGSLRASSISSISDSSEVYEYREGHEPLAPRKFSGRTTYGELEITRGLTPNFASFIDWRNIVKEEGSDSASRDMIITVVGPQPFGNVREYMFTGVWPTKIVYGALDANTSSVVLDSLTLVFTSVKTRMLGGANA